MQSKNSYPCGASDQPKRKTALLSGLSSPRTLHDCANISKEGPPMALQSKTRPNHSEKICGLSLPTIRILEASSLRLSLSHKRKEKPQTKQRQSVGSLRLQQWMVYGLQGWRLEALSRPSSQRPNLKIRRSPTQSKHLVQYGRTGKFCCAFLPHQVPFVKSPLLAYSKQLTHLPTTNT